MQGLEEDANKLVAQIDDGKSDKAVFLEKLMEAEREVLLHAVPSIAECHPEAVCTA